MIFVPELREIFPVYRFQDEDILLTFREGKYALEAIKYNNKMVTFPSWLSGTFVKLCQAGCYPLVTVIMTALSVSSS